MSRRATLVHLLRHGEVHNPGKVLYGRLPGFGLSPGGVAMAAAAADALAGRDVVLLVSSPLQRAQETAGPVAERLGLPVTLDERLLESENRFEGRSVGGGARAFLGPRDWRLLVNPMRPSWGEPYAQIARRVLAAVGDARTRAAGREAVLVTHQLPIYVVRRHVEGRSLWHRPDQRQCGLASLTTLEFRGDELVGVWYSEPAGAPSRKPVPPGA